MSREVRADFRNFGRHRPGLTNHKSFKSSKNKRSERFPADRVLSSKPCFQIGSRYSGASGIARIAGKRFLNALLDCLNGEVVADRCPSACSERFEDDIGVRENSDFRHTGLTLQIKRCGEVVLSKQLGQPGQSKTHCLGGFASRKPSVLQGLVEHLHESGRETLWWA